MEKLDERTYKFALRATKMVNALPNIRTGDVLGRQVLRSATSIGANVEEAIGAISKRESVQKMSIAAKESRRGLALSQSNKSTHPRSARNQNDLV